VKALWVMFGESAGVLSFLREKLAAKRLTTPAPYFDHPRETQKSDLLAIRSDEVGIAHLNEQLRRRHH